MTDKTLLTIVLIVLFLSNILLLRKGPLMNNRPEDRVTALAQINTIFSVLERNLRTALSGPLLIATGMGITLIPLFELLFSLSVDPIITQLVNTNMCQIVIFIQRTLFYWTSFALIGRHFSTKTGKNPFLEKIFDDIGKPFPFIAVATGGVMAFAGYSALISPIILLLIGTLFLFFGQFTTAVVRYNAYNLIAAGIIGVWLSTLHIPHLWMFLVVYQGLSFISIGIILNKKVVPDSIN